MTLSQRLVQYGLLVRLNKPIGILLLLWPTLWALWLSSEGQPDPLVLFVFISGVVLMRSAGCAINDFADRDFDAHVKRTQLRPLAQGRISHKEAVMVFVVLSLIAFVLVCLMNALTIALSFGGAVLAASYPFMKRYTHLPQMVLGVAFGWGVPMVYAAQTGSVPIIAWILFALTVLWTVAYDTQYAMVDRDDDVKIGIKSTAILFDRYDRLIIGLLHFSVILGFLLIGWRYQLSMPYFIGVIVATGFAIYQQFLIRHRQPSSCFKAFLNNNWFGLAIFAGIVSHYLWIA
ncbi:MAG: 4-hydroxybenzoate octaprenyltransferase [Gammaproteobacteria bacterium]|nr:4-hydroxybenzoate octaprenyltransferase [Gammaproteobacteria bacterium]MDH5728567.1 4-hydroxybenzoate octaprenyltransferase [Gammaproteobacteria bacterium]